MNKPSPIRFLVGVGGAAALLLSSNAFADDSAAKIWVDARPWTCASEVGPFARHVQLACDAVGGGCEVAASEKKADYRAALACADKEAWTLVLTESNGTEVFTLALDGDREQRLRKAAVWVAHASVGEPPPARRARPSAAPVPVDPPADPPAAKPEAAKPEAAKPEAPAVVVAAAPPTVVVVAHPPAPDATQDKAAPKKEEMRGGIALSGFAGPTSRRNVIAGGRAYAAFPLGAGFALAPTFNYARSVIDHGGGNLFLGGAMIGWGAPFGGRWIGFSIEGGAGASVGGDDDHERGARWGEEWREVRGGHAGTGPSAYGRAAVTLQIPLDFPVRPFVSVAGTHVSNQLGQSAQTAMLDVGFAWRAF